MENNRRPGRKNIWNLVLGLIFLLYGCYRVFTLYEDIEGNTLSFILAIGFIVFGLYDLWKYQKGL